MRDCERTLAARFERGSEVRELWYQARMGWLAIGEDTYGEETQLVYGERWHRIVVSLPPQSVTQMGFDLEGQVGRMFASGDVLLSDLMDQLDAAGVPYACSSTGESGQATYRPVPPVD